MRACCNWRVGPVGTAEIDCMSLRRSKTREKYDLERNVPVSVTEEGVSISEPFQLHRQICFRLKDRKPA